MRTFKLLGVASLAFGLLGACERKETTTTREVATTTPSTTATEPTTPVDRVPSSLDEKQPVAGHETPTTTTTTTTTTTESDIYTVSADGTRHMLHDSILLTEVQRKLQAEGVYSGPLDGRTSAEMESSISQFQAKKGLAQTGTLDRQTTEALGLEWNRFEYKADTGAGIGADVKKAGSEFVDETKQGAKEIGREIKEGAEKVEDSSAGQKMKTGIDRAGEKIESGANKAGAKIKEGVNKAGAKIKEGAQDIKEDIKSEPTTEPPRTY